MIGVKEGEKFVIVRFSSKIATHDFGYRGIPLSYKIECVKKFSKHARVFILSETSIDSSLKKFEIRIPPEKMHDLIYYATLVYTDGAKTACEAAILGTPSIYVDFKGRDYARELEQKYSAVYNFKDSQAEYEKSIQKGMELLEIPDIKIEWSKKREKILQENIDVTAFMSWFIENYPQCLKIIAANNQYQFNFK
jgi:hypothetical protein